VIAAARGRILACGALLVSIVLAGCAGAPPRSAAGAAVPDQPGAVTPPRSDRGNPPFYDVLGKRYYVLASSAGYRQRGVASWYGRDFHGLATSSGETYDMNAMTAAHTSLPIPTWVEVTNLKNGKRVIVKVNDRGPFVANRLIDLSYAAAVELDMLREGTTHVEVRALGASAAPLATASTGTAPAAGGSVAAAPAPVGATPAGAGAAPSGAAAPAATGGAGVAPVASSPPVPPPAGVPAPSAARPGQDQLFVQVGAFAERENAARLVDRLKANGFANSFVVSEDAGRRTLHRVRVGPLRDAHEFDQVSGRLKTLGVGDSHLVVAR
jgi:peptidoglycan lytic transglycosylase